MLVAPASKLLSNAWMDNKAVRRENLKGLLREAEDKGISNAEWCRAYGLSDRMVSQWKNGTRGIGDRAAKQLEAVLKQQKGWWDTLHFHSADHAMYAQEAFHIIEALTEAKRVEALDAWMAHGRLHLGQLPAGKHSPFPFPPGTEPPSKPAAKTIRKKRRAK